MTDKIIILLSGGLDSATALAIAAKQGGDCYALSFNYGQRHTSELDAARAVAEHAGVKQHRVLDIDLGQLGGSALTDQEIDVPDTPSAGIPVTYVPARNTIFLSFALAYAEVLGSVDIYIGVNAVDYSGYPDCRPEFIEAFEALSHLATKAGVEGGKMKIHAPLIGMTKADIIKTGVEHGVDYSLTISCYQADESGKACGVCDSCRLRKDGFINAGIKDPTRYQ
jgi:7-cyano-7-deazaguanine synthase